jgi:Methyltransferase domain
MKSLTSRLKQKILSKAKEVLVPSGFYFRHSGYCPCCRRKTNFSADNPWLRDYFRCTTCGSIPRNRALIRVLEKYHPNWENALLHESSPSGGGASAALSRNCPGYVASQYFPTHEFGTIVGKFRNEDLEKQTFEDASFDVVITQDVLEHVYDPARVFSEISRTLKPGGSHVFSVPLVNKHLPTQIWAIRNSDGSPNFLHEPDYHGNPVDPRGSPVTMRWGYDIVDFIKGATGLDTSIEYIDNLDLGIRAEYIEILVTRKPVASVQAFVQNAP